MSESQVPMPVEQLEYHAVEAEVWPRVLKIVAIVGVCVAAGRILQASGTLYRLWPGSGMAIGSGLQLVLNLVPAGFQAALGTLLLIGSIALLNRRAAGPRLIMISEICTLAIAPIVAVATLAAQFARPVPIPGYAYYMLIQVPSQLLISMAFPLVSVLMLRAAGQAKHTGAA